MFLRKYWTSLSVFLLLIVGIGLYLLATQPPKELVKIYKAVEPIEKPTPPTTAEPPVGDTSQDGHFHADGTWHEAEVPPTTEVSQPQPQDISTRIAQGTPNAHPITNTLSINAKREAQYQERVKQYLIDRAQWKEKRDKVYTERRQAGDALLQLLSDTLEKRERINSTGDAEFSDAEKQEITAKSEKLMENIDAAVKKLDTVTKEEPVSPKRSLD